MLSLIENIEKLLTIGYQWFWPNTKKYFEDIDLIVTGILQKNNRIICCHQYFLMFLSASMIRYFLIYILPSSNQYRIVIFDSSKYLQITNGWNLVLSFLFLSLIYMYKHFFAENYCQLNSNVVDLILGKRNDFIFENKSPTIEWSNYLRKRIRKHIVRRNLEICMTGSFLFLIPLYIVKQVMINWSEFFDSDYPHFFGYIKLVTAITTSVTEIFDSIFAFHMVELLFTFILCFYWLISSEYDRINQKIQKKQPSNRLLALFIRENTKLFIFGNRIFRLYSTIFLAYLVGFIPIDLYLVSCLMKIYDNELKADMKQLVFILTWIASHVVGMFGVHYVCTQYSNCIHSNVFTHLLQITYDDL
uniref:Uncharacterized protein LOC113793824 n=1 Tax=Dermatophagoides pteronyssinus TaxID=6956 RepID=A0A6P6Y2H5_DERPT|nr:uncharacterized protein LOC113793824 [Dermatophagoides pteronyssinus]